MHFSKLIIVPFFLSLAASAPTADPEAKTELLKRGFGCPFNRQQCNDHCITLKGKRTGGYCSGTFRLTCKCVFG